MRARDLVEIQEEFRIQASERKKKPIPAGHRPAKRQVRQQR